MENMIEKVKENKKYMFELNKILLYFPLHFLRSKHRLRFFYWNYLGSLQKGKKN